MKQLNRFADKLAASLKHSKGEAGTFANHRRFVDQWPATAPRLALPTSNTDSGNANRDRFLNAVTRLGCGDYIGSIQSLPADAKAEGTAWLQGIVDSIGSIWGTIKHV